MSEQFITRRDFMRLMAGVGISVAAAAALSNADQLRALLDQEIALETGERSAHAHGDARHRWGMVIDLRACIGCDYCVYACQAVNDVLDDMRWNVHLIDRTETGNVYHLTRPCLHCQDAPCAAVCPVGATFVREDGIVIMDYDKCIGCRYCQVACPYGARSFNWTARATASGYQAEWGAAEVEQRPRGVVEKCTFCVHRIDRGLSQGLVPGVDRAATPACVNICPVKARVFGDLNDPESPVSRLIAANPTFRLREDLGTEPNVYYIPPEGLI
ncbi:sulfate reduction electron transfer complex DsrMKJOP subunit DsrO [Candidatus Flexifilum breve]|uniref:sulfate reduction electron transfer complex DsrMKJOP subunit DsrO n=1 Tax=Candidatus Flexifilum breve TaxID=3140694 RepID=UPI0031CC60E7